MRTKQGLVTRLRRELSVLVGALCGSMLVIGCISPAPVQHDVVITTRYYREPAFPENEEYGLQVGQPARGAFIAIDVEGAASADRCRDVQALVPGMRIPADDCYYEGRLSENGRMELDVEKEAAMTWEITIAGDTPQQPDGCDRQYQSYDPHTGDERAYNVSGAAQVEVPFYIICFEGID